MPKWIKFTSPSSTGIIDAYIEVESSDIIYIEKRQNVWEVVFFPQHGIRKVVCKVYSRANAKRWIDRFLEREEQKYREKAWIENKGRDYDDFMESKFAEERER